MYDILLQVLSPPADPKSVPSKSNKHALTMVHAPPYLPNFLKLRLFSYFHHNIFFSCNNTSPLAV